MPVRSVFSVCTIGSIDNDGSSSIAETDDIAVSVRCRSHRVDCDTRFGSRNKV